VKVVDKLEENDSYDLVVVAIRKNKVHTVLPVLSRNKNIKNFLFIGNNALGFDAYLEHLPKEKVLFGFGRAGGGRKDHVVHYVDSEKPNGKRMSLVMGEIGGQMKERTGQIKALFESAEIPVEIVKDMDGWLKYHIAMVFPMCAALLKNDCDNYKLAENKEDVRLCLRAIKEAGNVLRALGYTKRQPFKLNLFYWMPEFLVVKIFQKILSAKFAEIAFAMHARAAADEFKEHAEDFKTLAAKTSVKTPNIEKLRTFFS
jgi:2-dehydropantoate 2-reductase